jgi:4-hydroxy-4-methyl-2-oxoglutarate aldolase
MTLSRVHETAAVATVAPGRCRLVAGLTTAWPGGSAVGRARTVSGVGGDNLSLHRALARAEDGEVLVASVAGALECGHWGELMTISAQARGVVGLIIDGTVRDRAQLRRLAFPVFCGGFDPRQASKVAPGQLDIAIELGGTVIEPGDVIVADDDGILAIDASDWPAVASAAEALGEREASIAKRLADGETTIEVLGLEDERS